MDGRQFTGHREVQDAVTAYIEHDLELRTGPDHPESLALFIALLKVYMELGRLVLPERLNARSQQDVHGRWHGFFSFVDSGPPPRRLREMLAVHRAGLLQFLGQGLSVAADEEAGGPEAGGAALPAGSWPNWNAWQRRAGTGASTSPRAPASPRPSTCT